MCLQEGGEWVSSSGRWRPAWLNLAMLSQLESLGVESHKITFKCTSGMTKEKINKLKKAEMTAARLKHPHHCSKIWCFRLLQIVLVLLLYCNNIKTSARRQTLQLKKLPGFGAWNMLQFSRRTKRFHKFGQSYQRWARCQNLWRKPRRGASPEAGWPKLNQNPVSYLATWQHGNVKLMLYNARHIPGPDAHQWCNSGSATSVHSANQSSLAFSPPLRVTAFTSDAVSPSFPFSPPFWH